ncbi:hypothetical protein [Pseudolysobacter antarcticus]|nr:hypothetical protein [Pseudolysobacter antarcticus]
MKEFPPRLTGQPIFYPVLNLQYASEIAERWNATGPSFSGYVTKFVVDDLCAARYEPHQVGAKYHMELWVPAGELSAFNTHISAPIEVASAFFGENFKGYVPERFGLKGKNVTEQFVALAHTLDYSGMDFKMEIKANHAAVFLNHAFWVQHNFSSSGIDESTQRRVLKAIDNIWYEAFANMVLPKPP